MRTISLFLMKVRWGVNIVKIHCSRILLQVEKLKEYMQRCDADYHLRTDDKTPEQKSAALKPIRDWCAKQDKNTAESTSLKSLSSRVGAIVDKFSTLVSHTLYHLVTMFINLVH